jgi:ABC-2 type transport system permease protein
LGAPKWLADVTPFAHVGLVPAQSFDAAGAAVMVALGVVAAVVAIWLFERRDLTGS